MKAVEIEDILKYKNINCFCNEYAFKLNLSKLVWHKIMHELNDLFYINNNKYEFIFEKYYAIFKNQVTYFNIKLKFYNIYKNDIDEIFLSNSSIDQLTAKTAK